MPISDRKSHGKSRGKRLHLRNISSVKSTSSCPGRVRERLIESFPVPIPPSWLLLQRRGDESTNTRTNSPEGVSSVVTHQILDHPSPMRPCSSHRGYGARIAILGDESPMSADANKRRWPNAPVASKPRRRIIRGGSPLPTNTTTRVILLSDIDLHHRSARKAPRSSSASRPHHRRYHNSSRSSR